MSLEKTQDGWSCVWGHREPRQRYGVVGDSVIGQPECDQHDPGGLTEGGPFWEYDVAGSESWEKRARWQYTDERYNRLQAEYLSPVPDEILTAISRFANRHWHLLNLVARCPGAFDLVMASPALALALSSLWVFRKNPPCQPLRAARSLLGKDQTYIAAWLGFPDASSTVQILRQLPPEECTILNLLQLRGLFGTHLETLQALSHIDGSIISAMSGEATR